MLHTDSDDDEMMASSPPPPTSSTVLPGSMNSVTAGTPLAADLATGGGSSSYQVPQFPIERIEYKLAAISSRLENCICFIQMVNPLPFRWCYPVNCICILNKTYLPQKIHFYFKYKRIYLIKIIIIFLIKLFLWQLFYYTTTNIPLISNVFMLEPVLIY